MTERYDPRRELGEYLATSGFRDHLILLLADIMAMDLDKYVWSPTNEKRRVEASLDILDILEHHGFNFGGGDLPSIKHPYLLGANLVLNEYLLETIGVDDVLAEI